MRMKLGSREEMWQTFSASALVSLTLFFFTPAHVYFANIMEFGVPFSVMALYLLLGIMATIATLMTALLVARFSPFAVSLVLMIGVLVWVQGHLLVWNYGVLDGQEIAWDRFRIHGTAEVAIWATAITAAAVFARRLRGLSNTVAAIILSVQTVSVTVEAVRAPELSSFHRYSIDETRKFDFSRDKNVLLLMLDEFQSDVFQEIIARDPTYAEPFDGFVYFRNSVAGYSSTYPTIPLLFTGKYYENDRPIQGFIKDVFTSASLPKTLMAAGWRVDLFPYEKKTLWYGEGIASNYIPTVQRSEHLRVLINLLDVSMFRSVPHQLKPWVLNNYRWRLITLMPIENSIEGSDEGRIVKRRSKHTHHAVRFMENFRSLAAVTGDQPSFKFYHLSIPHMPRLLNEELELTDLPSSRDGFVSYSKAALRITENILDQLINLGIYDNTMILVVSDHGGREISEGVNYEVLGIKDNTERGVSVPTGHLTPALPLILVKPFKGRGALKISDAPVSIADIADTVSDALALKDKFGGRSIFGIRDNEQRVRRYFVSGLRGWDEDYLPPMIEYEISGFSWFPDSWNLTGRILEGRYVKETEPAAVPYVFGDEINFGKNGNSTKYATSGWHTPESTYTWTNSELARLYIPFDKRGNRDGDFELIMEFMPYTVEGRVRQQRVSININGIKAGQWKAEHPGLYRAFIPKKTIEMSDALDVELNLPDAAIPAVVETNNDIRKLGIAVRVMRIDPISHYYKLGERIQFGALGNSRHYEMNGWSVAEERMTWTSGDRAELRLTLEDVTRHNLILEAELWPNLANGKVKKQRVILFANGWQVGQWNVKGEGIYAQKISAQYLEGQELIVSMELPDAISPQELGLSNDIRKLAIAVKQIVLHAAD